MSREDGDNCSVRKLSCTKALVIRGSRAVTIAEFYWAIIVAKRIHDYDFITINMLKSREEKSFRQKDLHFVCRQMNNTPDTSGRHDFAQKW